MSRETESIIGALASSRIQFVVTDINTDGQHTSTGNHYKKDCRPEYPCHPMDRKRGRQGRAVDFAQGLFDGRRDTPELLAIYNFFADTYGKQGLLNELYYSGPGADHCVRAGRWMPWSEVPEPARSTIRRTHHNHVHVAVLAGVFLKPPATPPVELVIHRQSIERHEGEEEMQPVIALCTRQNPPARWVLVPQTSELRALGGAQFYGSIWDLPEEHRPDSVYGISELPDRDGYLIAGWKDGNPDWYGAFDARFWAEHQSK